MFDLFPSKWIHIGGDEVLKKRWKECPNCQKRIEIEGLNNEHDLQTYFINRISVYLISLGKEVICWNDILEKKIVEKIICQYWIRHKKRVLEYIMKGGYAIMTNFKYTYLDHSYSFTPLKMAYKFEPIPKKLKSEFHKYILGLEVPMWGEYIPNIQRLEWQTFPRLLAFAETGWTPQNKKNYSSFKHKLNLFFKRLDLIGVNYANLQEVKPNILSIKTESSSTLNPCSIRYL